VRLKILEKTFGYLPIIKKQKWVGLLRTFHAIGTAPSPKEMHR
jgi:hypothetical protein